MSTVVIVGGGQAGGQAAASLRTEGFTGRIVMVGAEPVLPYQRPPLSKGFLAGALTVDRLLLKPEAFYEQGAVEPLLGVSVIAIDAGSRQLRLSDGGDLVYDQLLLATGGRPRPLTCPGAGHPRIHYIRTIADIDAMRPGFNPGARLTIIGAGYIGLEVAAVAARHGLAVTVLEAAPMVLGRVACPEVARFFQRTHQRAGVDIRCGVQVLAIEGDGTELRVVTNNGAPIAADLVVAGIGLLPNVELAETAGIACDNGIVVDQDCRTSVADIFAAGDCANQLSAIYGYRMRLESVNNAIEQAKAVAAAMCRKSKPFMQAPWFWSDQYDLKLQTAGINRGYDQIAVRGDPDSGSFAVFYLAQGRLLAVDAINRPAEFILARTLIPKRAVLSAERLIDEGIAVKDLAA
jgi:3-phenylpropionate/trans-cinnamate dioxygenase ferredoxin reductase subunit